MHEYFYAQVRTRRQTTSNYAVDVTVFPLTPGPGTFLSNNCWNASRAWIVSFCREIMPSRRSSRLFLKSSIRSCSKRATSLFTRRDTCSNSCFASRTRRSAYMWGQYPLERRKKESVTDTTEKGRGAPPQFESMYVQDDHSQPCLVRDCARESV